MAAHCPSCGAFSGFGSAFCHYREIRRAGCDSSGFLRCGTGFYPGHMGAVWVDDAGAVYCVHGIHAGISGAGYKKEAGLFHGQPGLLYFIWFVGFDGGCHDRSTAACGCPRLREMRSVSDSRCVPEQVRVQKSGSACGDREEDTEDDVVLSAAFPGVDRDSAYRRFHQQVVSGPGSASVGFGNFCLAGAGGAACERPADRRVSAAGGHEGILPGRDGRKGLWGPKGT